MSRIEHNKRWKIEQAVKRVGLYIILLIICVCAIIGAICLGVLTKSSVDARRESSEAPMETLVISDAVTAAIGTEREAETIGYDIEPVFKAVMSEMGGESPYAIQCVFTAVANEARLNNITPEEAVTKYQLATWSDTYSDEVKAAGIRVLIRGELIPEVGDATLFYNPDDGGISEYHELEKEVLEIKTTRGRIRFFEEEIENE